MACATLLPCFPRAGAEPPAPFCPSAGLPAEGPFLFAAGASDGKETGERHSHSHRVGRLAKAWARFAADLRARKKLNPHSGLTFSFCRWGKCWKRRGRMAQPFSLGRPISRSVGEVCGRPAISGCSGPAAPASAPPGSAWTDARPCRCPWIFCCPHQRRWPSGR